MQLYTQAKADHSIQKKIVFVNTCLYGSTGRIVRQIQDVAEKKGMMTWTVTSYDRSGRVKYKNHDIIIGNFFSRYLHLLISRFMGIGGLFSNIATIRLVKRLNQIKPDIIHLHNLHNAYINLPILFSYIKKNDIRVIWTLHDCWAFTGRCPYFDITNCSKWKEGCGNGCPFPKDEYPISYINNTRLMWKIKRKCFDGVQNLIIVTPSEWLRNIVDSSFLAQYKAIVINNGIDLSLFKPTEGNFKSKYDVSDKNIILGVALAWDRRKGIDVFAKLDELLSDEYQIVLIGVNEEQKRTLPSSIICIGRTNSQTELAEIYSAADVFLNPTREDNFPTVNIEALACGTPVITFNTGGSPEIIDDTCGIVVNDGDYDALVAAVSDICKKNDFTVEHCTNRARKYDMFDRFDEYIKLYE
jgi:putative colanic acid biosynthesis glycosyltransferase